MEISKQTLLSKKDKKQDNTKLIDILNDSLENIVNVSNFLDSISKQKNIQVITQLKEKWNKEEKCYHYFNSNYHFKLVQETRLKNNIEYINTTFFDGKTKIDFSDYSILKFKEGQFETENFGYNLMNNLENCRIIKIGTNFFLYADVNFMCTGIGCGCKINMIYDLNTHKPIFIENYRFPYSNFLISDFNGDNIPDLLLITKRILNNVNYSSIKDVDFKIFWLEYKRGKYYLKLDTVKKTYFIKLHGITTDFDHEGIENYSLNEINWI